MSDSHAGGILGGFGRRDCTCKTCECSTIDRGEHAPRDGLGDRRGTEEGRTARGRDGEGGDRRAGRERMRRAAERADG